MDSIPGVTTTATSYTYDQKHHVYYFAGSNKLYSIDALTGHVIHAPATIPNSFHSIRFDDRSGILYGNLYGIRLKVNPATADTTVLGGVAGVPGVSYEPNYTSMDNVHQRYTLAAYTTSPQRLITLDTLGNAIYNIPFPVGVIPSGENIIELNYDHHSGILYGLHFRDETAAGINDVALII